MTDTPKIYVADLAEYNAGTLRGVWIDATKEPEEIWAEVQAMLAGSPEPIAEEWVLHDHEGFGGIPISEWASFKEVHEIALLIEEHGAPGAPSFPIGTMKSTRSGACSMMATIAMFLTV